MKVVIAYYSATGNTQAMAEEIERGATEAGADVTLVNVADTTAEEVAEFDVIALGCASYGDEVLEEYEFQPFYDELEPLLDGKKVALFGSYDWGQGEWMQDWQDAVQAAGAELINGKGLIINLYPDAAGLQECYDLGQTIAQG